MRAFVEIYMPGNGAERHELATGRTIVGTGEAATICLPISTGLEAEQLEILVIDQHVCLQVPANIEGRITFEGTQQREFRVPFGAEVFIGNIRLAFLQLGNRSRVHPVLLLAAPLVLVLAGLAIDNSASPINVTYREVPAPALFDEDESAQCPQVDSEASVRRAQDDERAAQAKLERSAFVVQDGPEGATLLQRARVCFAQAGRAEDAARVREMLARSRDRLNEQYTSLRLRLRLALDRERPCDALSAIRQLESLLLHRDALAYRQWLSQLGHRLDCQLTPTSP